MVTGAADGLMTARSIEAGCSGLISKNRPLSQVVRGIRDVHRGEMAVDPALLAQAVPFIDRSRRRQIELTKRETEILRLLIQGMTTRSIAEHLILSRHTVRNHIANLLLKLGAHSKLEAVSKAVQRGLISLTQ